MRSIETSVTFPLSSVKPLEGLSAYRAYCLDATRHAIAGGGRRRDLSRLESSRDWPISAIRKTAASSWPTCRMPRRGRDC